LKKTVFAILLIVLLVFMVIGPFGIKPTKAVQPIEISYDSGTADSYASPGTNWGFGVMTFLNPASSTSLTASESICGKPLPGPA
jgi:hypothetical protein